MDRVDEACQQEDWTAALEFLHQHNDPNPPPSLEHSPRRKKSTRNRRRMSLQQLQKMTAIHQWSYHMDTCLVCQQPVIWDWTIRHERTCTQCGMVDNVDCGNAWVPTKPSLHHTSIVYSPIYRMTELLKELQCKRKSLPEGMVEKVRTYLKYPPYSYYRVRKALRPLGYKQHYLMIPTLLYYLNPSFVPLQLSPQEVAQILRWIQHYTRLWTQYPSYFEGRKNGLNYAFLLMKFLQHLHHPILPWFCGPRGYLSKKQHERIWKTIEPFIINCTLPTPSQ